MSAFNYGELEALFNKRDNKRADLVFMAKTAEQAERYEDMCRFMKELVNDSTTLSVEERNLLSVAYKNVIGARRASYRTLVIDNESSGKSAPLIDEYKRQLEAELDNICKDVLELLENQLIKKQEEEKDNDEALVFYLKMAADYYRYLAECVTDKGYDSKAVAYYQQAVDKAAEGLQATHPIRLGLALNYSVCLYEIKRDKTKACELAKEAFDEAISKLDKLEETDYKDSTLIMQLLRDNLTLWTSSEDQDDDAEN